MAKEVVIRLTVPDWVDVERVKETALRVADEVIGSAEQSVDEARRFFRVGKVTNEIEVPESLGADLLRMRRKRVW